MDASVSGYVRIRDIYKVFFICFVAFGLYYPSIFSDFNSIDDVALISHLEDTNFNLFDLLIPGRSHYYRPVIWLTYYVDKYAWGLEPSFMHLTNIIIHAFNAILVFLLAKRVCGGDEKRIELPLLMALLFAAHPINTEAVCWVAGRTDPLATLFILAAGYCLAREHSDDKFARLLIPAGLIFLGCLAKEVAFFFFPPAYLSTLRLTIFARERKFSWGGVLRPAAPFLFFALLYLYLRRIALAAEDNSVNILLKQNADLLGSVATVFKTFGFYVKKLFMPLPLNFAIVSYSNGYILLGIAVLVLTCWSLPRKRNWYYFLGCSLFLILPAAIIAVKRVAWTPVAERYLYAPTAFFVIAFAGSLHCLLVKRKYGHLLPFLLVVIIVAAAYFTVQRNIVWQDNYLLYKDAVAKSPQFARVRNEYAVALHERGERGEAFKQFKAGETLDRSYILPPLNLANMKFREGKPDEALQMLAGSYKEKGKAELKALKLEARIYESLLFKENSDAKKQEIFRHLIENYQYIFAKEKDPYIAYRSGQVSLMYGDRQKAALLFATAAREAPADAFYREAAIKLAVKLGSAQ